MTVPEKWINFVRRIFGLRPGRWVILLTVRKDGGADYEVLERGSPEK